MSTKKAMNIFINNEHPVFLCPNVKTFSVKSKTAGLKQLLVKWGKKWETFVIMYGILYLQSISLN